MKPSHFPKREKESSVPGPAKARSRGAGGGKGPRCSNLGSRGIKRRSRPKPSLRRGGGTTKLFQRTPTMRSLYPINRLGVNKFPAHPRLFSETGGGTTRCGRRSPGDQRRGESKKGGERHPVQPMAFSLKKGAARKQRERRSVEKTNRVPTRKTSKRKGQSPFARTA